LNLGIFFSAEVTETAERFCPDIVFNFILRRAKINARDKQDHTPLYFAKKSKNREVEKFLVRHGGKE